MESDSALMEPQTVEEAAPIAKRSFPKPLSIDREAVKALSMAGMSDNEIIGRFPHLPSGTLKKWRQRDPVWAAVFKATRRPETLVTAAAAVAAGLSMDVSPVSQTAVSDAQSAVSAEIVTKMAGDSLMDLHNATALSLVKASHGALSTFAQSAPVPKDWGEAATAYKVQRLACGIDKEGQQVSLNLTMFSEGHQGETVEGAWEVEGEVIQEEPYDGEE